MQFLTPVRLFCSWRNTLKLPAVALAGALSLTVLTAPGASAAGSSLAGSFSPSAEVYVSSQQPAWQHADRPAQAGTAPALTAITKFNPPPDELLGYFGMTMPLHWRVNGEATPDYCDKYEKAADYKNCPAKSKVGEVLAYTTNNPPDDQGNVCNNVTELCGSVYLLKNLPTDPVQFALVFPDTYQGVVIPPIVASMYMLPGSFRIQTDLDSSVIPQVLMAPMRSLYLSLNGGNEESLFRTSPAADACSYSHIFDWSASSRANPPSTVGGNSSASEVDCEKVSKPLNPTVKVQTSTTQAGANPAVNISIDRPKGNDYLSSMQIDLPDGMMGSPSATKEICTADQAKVNQCPAASRVAGSYMEAKVFESLDPIKVSGSVYMTTIDTCADPTVLACLVFVGTTPKIASEQIITIPVQLTTRPGLAGVTAVLGKNGEKPMPPEFDLRHIEFNFEGATGSEFGHPLLINPTDCDAHELKVTLGGETGTSSTSTTPYQATGCDKLSYSPSMAVFLSSLAPNGIPQVDIGLTGPPTGAATTKNVTVQIPKSFKINSRSALTQCTDTSNCPDSSQVGYAEMKSPLIDERLTGKLYIAPPDNPDAVKKIITKVEGSISMTLEGDLVQSPGGGFSTVLRNLPEVPIEDLKITVFGGSDRGLVVTPSACGEHTFHAISESHDHRSLTVDYPIKIAGPECRPGLKAGLSTTARKKRSKLKLSIRPNEGTPVERARFDLGSFGVKVPSKRGRVGTLTVLPRKGGTTTSSITAKRRSLKVSRRVSALKISTVSIRGKVLTVTGLGSSNAKEINIELDGAKTGIVTNPKKCGSHTIKGSFTAVDGGSYSSDTKLSISCRK